MTLTDNHAHLDKAERGCLVLLWIVSPIVALVVWGFVKLALFFKWAINEDLRGRYEGTSPSALELLFAWWETAWLLIVVGVVGILILAPLYGWACIATIRWIKSRPKRR
jgi:hypothetical protein